MNEQLKNTIEALKRNRINAIYAETAEEACEAVKRIVPSGSTVSCGGSETLKQSGVYSLISQPPYVFLDRSRPGITSKERLEVYKNTVGCDYYFCSANAVTENGELVNTDGIGNRVSAIAFGPERVIVVVGINKLVKTVDDGLMRIKRIAAPKNAVRLQLDTPCASLGHCVALEHSCSPAFTDGCRCESRICSSYLVTAHQMKPGRITVILCGEALGY